MVVQLVSSFLCFCGLLLALDSGIHSHNCSTWLLWRPLPCSQAVQFGGFFLPHLMLYGVVTQGKATPEFGREAEVGPEAGAGSRTKGGAEERGGAEAGAPWGKAAAVVASRLRAHAAQHTDIRVQGEDPSDQLADIVATAESLEHFHVFRRLAGKPQAGRPTLRMHSDMGLFIVMTPPQYFDLVTKDPVAGWRQRQRQRQG